MDRPAPERERTGPSARERSAAAARSWAEHEAAGAGAAERSPAVEDDMASAHQAACGIEAREDVLRAGEITLVTGWPRAGREVLVQLSLSFVFRPLIPFRTV